MFTIRSAAPGDVDAIVAALGEAFAQDPLMAYLFGDSPTGILASTQAFFSILLRARLALEMPAIVVVVQGDELLGAAMGYDTSRPAWPATLAEEWRRFEADAPAVAARMAAYEQICEAHEPVGAHHYLGVIGVRPSRQSQGAGKALLEAFCAGSRADPRSGGVYLHTSNPSSLAFYDANGFERRGEGRLGSTPLWCAWRQT